MRQDITTEVEISFLKAQLRKATLLGNKKPGADMEMLQKFLELERQSKSSSVLHEDKILRCPSSRPSLA